MLEEISKMLGINLTPDFIQNLLGNTGQQQQEQTVPQVDAYREVANQGGLDQLLMNILQQTPGKGMDDDVAAQIDGQTPAALSEGEYVFPADVVSLLGDGNNEAGSKVLEQLIAGIRQLKTGSTEQAPPLAELLASQQ